MVDLAGRRGSAAITVAGRSTPAFAPPRGGTRLHVVVVRVRDQCQETRALDGGGQLALVARLGAGDAAGNDLAVLGEVLAKGVEILVIDLLDALGGELAELAAAEELGHACAPQAASALSPALSLLSLSLSLDAAGASSSSRRRRSPRSGLSPFSSLFFMISDCSVSGPSRRMTRWRSTASLKRNASTSSSSAACAVSMLNST